MRAIPVEIDWHPGISIYASESFLRTVGDEYGWIGGIDDSGQLRCVLPYTVVRKAILRMVRFRVETIPLKRELDVVDEKLFLNRAVEYLRSTEADMIIPASTNTIFRVYPDGAVAAPYGSYIIDLTQPEETLWGNLNSSHRRKVRLAMNSGVQIRSGVDHVETAYRLVRDTFRRSALPFMNYDRFERMVLGLGENVKVFIAEHEGAVQGCAVMPFSSHSAYYVYGGSISQPVTGATNLLHWRAIQLFRDLGVKHYDFVGVRINPEKGSKQEGLMIFKERFGGQLVQGYIWKYAFHPLRYFLYRVAAKVRSGGDIVDNEHHKLKASKASPAALPTSRGIGDGLLRQQTQHHVEK
jgi:Acetyltransferase (GNAT) domain